MPLPEYRVPEISLERAAKLVREGHPGLRKEQAYEEAAREAECAARWLRRKARDIRAKQRAALSDPGHVDVSPTEGT